MSFPIAPANPDSLINTILKMFVISHPKMVLKHSVDKNHNVLNSVVTLSIPGRNLHISDDKYSGTVAHEHLSAAYSMYYVQYSR